MTVASRRLSPTSPGALIRSAAPHRFRFTVSRFPRLGCVHSTAAVALACSGWFCGTRSHQAHAEAPSPLLTDGTDDRAQPHKAEGGLQGQSCPKASGPLSKTLKDEKPENAPALVCAFRLHRLVLGPP